MLRAVAKSGGQAFMSLKNAMERRLSEATEKMPELQPEAARLLKEMNQLIAIASKFEVTSKNAFVTCK